MGPAFHTQSASRGNEEGVRSLDKPCNSPVLLLLICKQRQTHQKFSVLILHNSMFTPYTPMKAHWGIGPNPQLPKHTRTQISHHTHSGVYTYMVFQHDRLSRKKDSQT